MNERRDRGMTNYVVYGNATNNYYSFGGSANLRLRKFYVVDGLGKLLIVFFFS